MSPLERRLIEAGFNLYCVSPITRRYVGEPWLGLIDDYLESMVQYVA